MKAEYFPNQFSVVPQDGDSVTVGGTSLTWHAVDTKEYNVNLYHFAHSLGKPSSFVLFWALTVVNCSEELPGVRLAIGSNGGGATDFCARFLDPNEKPLKGFTVSVGEVAR